MAKYKCPQCGAQSEQPGNCPTCNVPMVEMTEGGAAETQGQPQPQQPTEPTEPQPPQQ